MEKKEEQKKNRGEENNDGNSGHCNANARANLL